MDEFEIPRNRMIKRLRDHYKIQDERVLMAMSLVARHYFVPTALMAKAYSDNALPIAGNQTISQPSIVARMTELLELQPQSRVLDIGSGSGYQTAILANLSKQVFAVERVAQLAAEAQQRFKRLDIHNVSLRCGDGTLGWAVFAPFDGIMVAAGSPSMPEPLLGQLKLNGKLVIPIGQDQSSQRLIRVTRTAKGFKTEDFGACAFVPLIGEHGWK